MLAKFVEAISRQLAFLWRSFGSPRIAGDEKAIRAVREAWASSESEAPGAGARGSAGKVGTGVSTRGRNVIVASSGVIIAVLVLWLVFVGFGARDDDSDGAPGASTGAASPTPFAGPVYLTEVEALSSAVAAARENGLVSSDFAHISRRIRFGEYAEAIGETYRAERGLLATPSDTEVWAFAFSGNVELKLVDGEIVKYDNLTVILDALTGHVYRVEAFYGEYESEARAPVWLSPPTPTPAPTPDADQQ
ncbi:MAG: hypothetical protein IIC28_09190 [Chloroflexi bacterium]|nr:hypothetical protein [Chloroflexota bacterium]